MKKRFKDTIGGRFLIGTADIVGGIGSNVTGETETSPSGKIDFVKLAGAITAICTAIGTILAMFK